MDSTKHKKKQKPSKVPKPMKVEKDGANVLHPMEHYMDDRIELIRQIFFSLKPKTIKNLAPDFLKKRPMEYLQEQCLNEILGISEKRLLSIINNTRCPTDTESSSDEDVISIREHVSLEEISSDSDIDDQNNGKGRKKAKEKQCSVLELLELQARARAIRSQLAFEPVTKIELNSDSEKETRTKNDSNLQSSSSQRKSEKPKKNDKKPPKEIEKSNKPTTTSSVPEAPPPKKRIKLKRNFRKLVQDIEEEDKILAEAAIPKPGGTKHEAPTAPISRSASPDVIPIITDPVTLCISDSDDEKPAENVTSEKNVTGENCQTEKSEITTEVQRVQTRPPPGKPPLPKEREEGEISEEDEQHPKEVKCPIPPTSQKKNPAINIISDIVIKPVTNQPPAGVTKPVPNQLVAAVIKPVPNQPAAAAPNSEVIEDVKNKSDTEDGSIDDVISLEGGDLFQEIKDHLEEDLEDGATDVIILDDSSEDNDRTGDQGLESWNDRWLKSTKVSKVLATSRLGNRVRKNIKMSNKEKKMKDAVEADVEKQKQELNKTVVSKYEEGSLGQYHEIKESTKTTQQLE